MSKFYFLFILCIWGIGAIGMSRKPHRETCDLAELEEEKWQRWRKFNTQMNAAPDVPGIYEFAVRSPTKTKNKLIVLYIGASENMRKRHLSYLRDGSHMKEIFDASRKDGLDIWMRFQRFPSPSKAFLAERKYLETFDYAWNKIHNHAKRPTKDAVAEALASYENDRPETPLRRLPEWQYAELRKQFSKKDTPKAKGKPKSKAAPVKIPPPRIDTGTPGSSKKII